MNRREFLSHSVAGAGVFALANSLLAAGAPAMAATAAPAAFSRAGLVEEARKLSGADYAEPKLNLPEGFDNLTHEQYRDIRLRAEQMIWRDDNRGFRLEPLHTGFIYRSPVQIHLVEDGLARRIDFNRAMFDYGPSVKPPADNVDLSFSGFKLRRQIHNAERYNEFLVFQGATYFRCLAKGMQYGLSARGLAIDTADPQGEEFPAFTKFWIEQPEANATAVVVHALLDSPSTTGAYRFTLRPGDETSVDVELTLFPRVELDHVGIAPLTSMFLYDGTIRTRFDDIRPAVHGSDGLAVWSGGGEWIWRPLANPRNLQISAFVDQNPRGFGLLQRSRDFAEFEDLETRFDLRPSGWVEPIGDWGQGAVELIEIPSESEIHDNIVCYWRPKSKLPAGQEFTSAYRLHWGPSGPDHAASSGGTVADTRSGQSWTQGIRRFFIDFVGPMPAPGLVKVEASASAGKLTSLVLRPNLPRGGYRVSFELDARDIPLSELRVLLTDGAKPVSETWLYRWTP